MCVFGAVLGLLMIPTLEKADQAHLLRTAKEVGLEIKRDPELCHKVKGLRGYFSPNRFEIGLCRRDDEPKATLRHELIHAVQHCKNGQKVMPERDFHQEALGYGWKPELYPEREWTTEAEARVLEHELGDGAIAGLLTTYCSTSTPIATR